MFGRSFPLFTLFGFQVRLDPSWLFLALLFIWTLSLHLFPVTYPGQTLATYLGMGVLVVLGLFASIVLHEFSHAWIARRFGIPMHGITLFIFGGMAEMTDEPPSPKGEFWMALAGPAASFLLLLFFAMLTHLGQHGGWLLSLVGVSAYLAKLNQYLILFNMIPAFPMDGGRVLRALLWAWKKDLRWATRVTTILGNGFGILLMLMGILSLLQGTWINGFWWIMMGMFLRNAASLSYRQVLLKTQRNISSSLDE